MWKKKILSYIQGPLVIERVNTLCTFKSIMKKVIIPPLFINR